MDEKKNVLAFYPLLLDGRERAALHTLLYQYGADELLRGIRDKLTLLIAAIDAQPQQAGIDELEAKVARLMRRI